MESEEAPGTFAKEWTDLEKRLQICHYLERADRLSGIGQFGVLFLGFGDAAPVHQPVTGRAPLLYLAPYGEHNITVQKWDLNEKSARFGLPELYTLQSGRGNTTNKRGSVKSITVHHSRVIHLSEFRDDDEVYGIPRLLPAYNYLEDLEKVVGGGAETFWLAANRGILWSADSNAEFDEEDLDRLKAQSEEYEHQLRRSITGTGLKAQVLGSDTPSPQGNADTLIQLIAGTYGMPQRLLTGSESGELASSQDASNWNVQKDDRRQNYASPYILRPLIEKLIETGNLSEPQGTFTAGWDPVASLSEKEQADINNVKSTMLAAYINADGADLLVPPREFRAEFLGLPEESKYMEEELDDDEDDEDVQAGFGGAPQQDEEEQGEEA